MSLSNTDASPLGALEQALQEERRALLDNDVLALLASTEAKVRALRQAEAAPPDHSAAERVNALRQLNQANGILLARRRREVDWALRHLGRVESTGTYNAAGLAGTRAQGRSLAVV
ncbi:hypothetical protein SAMN05428989_0267 [Pseudoxanthomonas sp. GM95]|uniref:hypothetical protein n=1 Tax=Pseudoxanthomonas sp. GM95 TaxID=1881043 RepID=UPI0008C91F9D|nr:hypothetical protein [Pseudoxanthomonas sp. GM95]SEK52006.1 hypothetical protein SAMN05428989_0267 [Pseudoxanthomonas sp. GM95]